jgi:geranylgeranyl diphosphate synthase type II
MNAAEIKSGIESCLKAQAFDAKQPKHLYEPMAYLLEHEAKRVRPVLAVLAYRYCGGQNLEGMIETATAIELVHNFTLMHDDIMDHAPTRRGKATVHEKWDTNIAILSGDALFALAYPLLIKNFPHQASELVNFFTKVVVEVCEGQMEDMDLAGSATGGIPVYLEMIRKKTAVLIGGSLGIGAIAAGASKETVNKIYQAGELMGIGFQLQDDLLDVYAAQADFGKQVGGDIIENKKTYLLLRAMEKADRYRKEALLNWMQHQGNATEKIAGVIQLFNELEIREEVEAKISGYFREAETVLNSLQDEAGKAELLSYLEMVFQRKK